MRVHGIGMPEMVHSSDTGFAAIPQNHLSETGMSHPTAQE